MITRSFLILCFVGLIVSCDKEQPEVRMLITYEVETEVTYTRIDSIRFVDASLSSATIVDVQLPWAHDINVRPGDSLGFTLYGETANAKISEVLNSVTMKINGRYENGSNKRISERLDVEPLTDTLELNHSLSFR